MNNNEFLLLLSQNWGTFLCALCINSFLIYLLRNRIHSIIDPLFFCLVSAVCANTVPMFLYIEGYVSSEKFVFFIIAETFFWLGFYVRSKKGITIFIYNRFFESNVSLERKIFVLFFSFIVISNIFIFVSGGIPLLMDSRFEIFQGNKIIVLLNRISLIPELYCYIYTYNQIKKRKYQTILLVFILVFIKVLYGSKGYITNLVFAYFFYSIFYLKQYSKLKLKYALGIIISPIIVITIYYGIENYQNAFLILIYRFIASGDGYWQGFSNDLIDGIKEPIYAFERTFSFILGPIGLMHTEAKVPLGTLILSQINPGVIETIEGPNARPPLFAWYCFGWNGVFFTFLCGYLMAYFLNSSLYRIPKGLIGTSVVAAIYCVSMSFSTDPTLALAGLVGIAVFVIILNVTIKILSGNNVDFIRLRI